MIVSLLRDHVITNVLREKEHKEKARASARNVNAHKAHSRRPAANEPRSRRQANQERARCELIVEESSARARETMRNRTER